MLAGANRFLPTLNVRREKSPLVAGALGIPLKFARMTNSSTSCPPAATSCVALTGGDNFRARGALAAMSLALYEAGEHVLAYHASALYEAKVLQTSRTAAGGWSYLIHYAGWKSTWDEWAPPERLLPLTDANRERAKMLSEALRAASGKKRGGGSTGGGTRKSASNGAVTGGSDDALDSAGVGVKRRRIDVSRETEDDGAPAAAIGGLKLALPFPLKRILVDDWDFVTQRCVLLRSVHRLRRHMHTCAISTLQRAVVA